MKKRKRKKSYLLSSFLNFLFLLFCLLPYFPPQRPYARIFLSFSSSCVFFPVKQQLSSCCFVRATGICSSSARMAFLWRLRPFLSSPIFLHHILQNTCRLSWFVLLLFSFFSSSFSLCFSFFLWSGLFCCVLVPGTLALHLLYLGELRLFGLLCFTLVYDHIICISLGWRISTDSGCTDVVE